MRTGFDRPEYVRELSKRLQGHDDIIQRFIIIGVLLSFRALCQKALKQNLRKRIPFLMYCLDDYEEAKKEEVELSNTDNRVKPPLTNTDMVLNDMLSSAGVKPIVDATLVNAFRVHKIEGSDDDYHFACMLLACLAFSVLPIARLESTVWDNAVGGFTNNAHCLGSLVSTLFPSLFQMCNHQDIEERMKEFLALASSMLLRRQTNAENGKDENQSHAKSALGIEKDSHVLLDTIVRESGLTQDLVECCFPYALLRSTYQSVLKA